MARAILIGFIVIHAAFPEVFLTYPERKSDEVAGYVAVNDCAQIGRRYVLVRHGLPDVLVQVADCAQPRHVPWRRAEGIVADVDINVWHGGQWPQWAELWLVSDRARWERRWLASDSIE